MATLRENERGPSLMLWRISQQSLEVKDTLRHKFLPDYEQTFHKLVRKDWSTIRILDLGANSVTDLGSTAISFHGEHASHWLLLCEAEVHYWTRESRDPPSGYLAFPE